MGVRKRNPLVKRPQRAKSARRRPPKAGGSPVEDSAGKIDIHYGAAALHDLFQQQVRTMLDRTDLDEEQKQGVLLATSCPCCGSGGMSFTVKLKPRR
jgi:hypothetical protein